MINSRRLEQTFCELVAINSPSKREKKLAQHLIEKLNALGLEVFEDNANLEFGGTQGNVIARLNSVNNSGPRILLTAHMDRVEPGENIEVVKKDNILYSAGNTILAADDVSGIAPILEVLTIIKEQSLNHYPLEIVFTVAEEIGLLGAKGLKQDHLTADIGYALDSNGPVGNIIVEAPTQNQFTVEILGKAAHAGVCPEEGINSIKAASVALAQIELGRIDQETTANIGTIKGGKATNIVPGEVKLEGEVRSLKASKLNSETAKIESIFQEVSQQYGAKCIFNAKDVYPPFNFSAEDQVVKSAIAAFEKLNWPYQLLPTGGGSDANIINGKGVPTVNLATGMEKAHSIEEYQPLDQLEKITVVLLELIKAN